MTHGLNLSFLWKDKIYFCMNFIWDEYRKVDLSNSVKDEYVIFVIHILLIKNMETYQSLWMNLAIYAKVTFF